MTYKQILVTFTILTTGALALGSRLSFSAGTLPKGWFAAGSHPQDYEMIIDTAVRHSGQAGAHTKFIGEKAEGFGTLMQMFKADDYRGKRMHMSAWMKSEDADSAQLWMQLDGAKRILGFDNMNNRAVKGTTEWKKDEITLDVPEGTIDIAFGAFVAGKGEAWVDDFGFEVVSEDVSSINMLTPEQMKEEHDTGAFQGFPKEPANFNFEEK
jgi:hypothetical protein